MNILHEADEAVSESRMQVYGHPAYNYDILKPMWSAIFGVEINDTQVGCAMICLKLARELTNPGHRDNLVDTAGHARVLELVYEHRQLA